MKRVIFYTGKGGTGKTVTSCATALACSNLGYRVLLMSTDPAHTLSDAFSMHVGNEATLVRDNLYAMQIDPVVEMGKQYQQLLAYLASLFSSRGIDETIAYEIAMLPGMTQLFSMLRLEELSYSSEYDVAILDMMASGEALRYLYLPKLVGSLSRRLFSFAGLFSGMARLLEPIAKMPAPSSDVIKTEMELIGRLERLADILKDRMRTSVRLVANPDIFSIENAKRALMAANLFGLNVDLAVINKIMPRVEEPYFAEWLRQQEERVRDAEMNFYPVPVRKARLFESELRGMDMLERYARELFGGEDPAKVLFNEDIFSFEYRDDSFSMRFRVPFTEKDDFELERLGDQLTIKVKGAVGNMVNIVPLPSATVGMRLSKARLQGSELIVTFER
ncbi:MAG: ArsA family ATPase [Candidatus Nitrosocaldus sp.]|nr:ArsA family ATPase [Candidatus Nitrosocaldus sp.]MDW8000724.1 ArsA family ATPase [Candidatus Nitrosocaldus sp.]